METCWTIVERARAGDSAAQSRFARDYLGVVRCFLAQRWRGSPAMAHLDDAVQEVFVDLFRRGGALERFAPEKAPRFRSFLFGVARKVALRQEERAMKRASRMRREPISLDGLPRDEPTMSRAFDRNWALAIVKRARRRMKRDAHSEQERLELEILRLRFAEGKPIREIARLWDMEAAQLHKLYARARASFQKALRHEVQGDLPASRAEIDRECRTLLEFLG